MKRFTVIATLLLLSLLLGIPTNGQVKESKTIRLVAVKKKGVVGKTLQFRVSYCNDGDKPWALNQPDQSIEDLFCYVQIDSGKEIPHGQYFGTRHVSNYKAPDGSRRTIWGAAPRNPISIAPGTSYDFDFTWKWSADVVPATYTVWVKHRPGKLASNRFEIPIWFTDDSIEQCLSIAADKSQPKHKRKWAGKWLSRLLPGFELAWPPHKATEEVRDRHEKVIAKKMDECRAFLETPENVGVVQAGVDQINSTGGLPIEREIKHRILLSCGKGPFAVGQTIPLEIRYLNEGEGVWALTPPEQSSEERLHYKIQTMQPMFYFSCESRPITGTYADPHGEETALHQSPSFRILSIAPGGDYRIKASWQGAWTGRLFPGIYKIWVTSSQKEVESKGLEIPLWFTRDSLVANLAVAEDKTQPIWRRKRYGHFLARMRLGFRLTWWEPDASKEEQARQEEAVAKQLADFKEFLADPKNAEKVQLGLDRINRDAGLPVIAKEPIPKVDPGKPDWWRPRRPRHGGERE